MRETAFILALYGTLRQGGRLHRAFAVDRARYIGKGMVEGYSISVCPEEWFPRAFRDIEGSVLVEVYSMDRSTAGRIIDMETAAGYRLEDCIVSFDDGRTSQASIFVCDRPKQGCEEIPGGDWMQR